MVWGIGIACYLFFAGLGSGLYLVSFLADRYPGLWAPRVSAHVASFVFVAFSAMFLLTDARAGLAHPLRLLGLLSNIYSPLAWGTLFIVVFLAANALSIVLLVRERFVPSLLSGMCALSAFLVALYSGVLLGLSAGFPLWNPVLLPVVFLLSALASGQGVARFMALFHEPQGFSWFGKHAFSCECILIASELCAVVAFLIAALFGQPSAHSSAVRVVSGDYALVFWLGFVLCGLVLPLVGCAVQTFCAKGKRFSFVVGALSMLSTCVGSFSLRLSILLAALPLMLPAMGA